MPTLWFQTFVTASSTANGEVLQQGTINIAGTATLGDKITGLTTGDKKKRTARIFADGDCYIAIGDSSVSATSADIPIRSEDAEYFSVEEGQYISVIERTAT